MKNTFKVILLILCLSLSFVLLTACFGDEETAETTVDTADVVTGEVTQASTEADAVTEATTEALSEATTQAVTEVATQAVTEVATQAVTEAATEVVTEAIAEIETEAVAESETLDEATLKDMLANAYNISDKQPILDATGRYITVTDDVTEVQNTRIKKDGSNFFMSYAMDGEEMVGYTLLQDTAYVNIFGTKEYFLMTADQRAELLVDMDLVEDENTEIIEYIYTAEDFNGLTGVVNADGSVTITVPSVSEDVMSQLVFTDSDAINLMQTLDSYVVVIDPEGRLVSVTYQVTVSYDYEADGATVSVRIVSQAENTYAYADVVIQEPENQAEYMRTTFDVYMGYAPDAMIAAAWGLALDADSYTLDASNQMYDVERQYELISTYPGCYANKTFTIVGYMVAPEGDTATYIKLTEDSGDFIALVFSEGVQAPADGEQIQIVATFVQVDDTCEGANFLCFAMQVTEVEVLSADQGDEDIPQGTFMYVNTVTSPLRVRTGPSTDYEIIGSLPRGTRIDVLSIADGWATIVFAEGADGIGYVSASYISETQPV